MILKDLLEQVATVTSVSDRDTLVEIVNRAASEIWESTDLPGSLYECYFNLEEGDKYITLPHYVHAIRGVKPCGDYDAAELNTPTPAFNDGAYTHSRWRWRILRITPLLENIEEATTLKIRAVVPVEDEVILSLAGPTDIAERGNESILFSIGDQEKFTVGRYKSLDLLVKDIKTPMNFLIYDGSDKLVAEIANNMLEAKNTLIQVYDNCSSALITGCCAVLYKPTLPPLIEDLDTFPEAYGNALFVKFLEWANLVNKENVDFAVALAGKSNSLVAQVASDYNVGKTQRFKVKRSVSFTSRRIEL